MNAAIRAGTAYFLIVFAIGFVLGVLRILLVIPALGEVAALAIELPLMLALSWLICRWLLRHYAVPAEWLPRLAMGVLAFGLLMVAELALSVFVLRQSASQHWAGYAAPAAQAGLAAQLVFASFPLWRRGP